MPKEMVRWFHRNYGLTLLIVVWGLVLFTMVTWKVFFHPVDIPTGTAATYSTFFVFVGTILGLWKWKRDKSDRSIDNDD